MKFDKYAPCSRLQPYIKHFIIAENELATTYKVFPEPGLVIGFQYKGLLSNLVDNINKPLHQSGITGISDHFKVFSNSANVGSILVYFTEVGFCHFSKCPANELFNLSLSLEDIFNKYDIAEVEDKLAIAATDKARMGVIETFLLSQLNDFQADKLVIEAIKLIQQSNGTIKIKELNQQLFTSQSPLEKRFRKVVGTTAKKFASIVRFNHILNNFGNSQSLLNLCYEHNFFDQAHFIKNFKQYTGDSPEHFKRLL